MSIFTCTLGPEGAVRIHDAVLCLARFSDAVGLEVLHDKVGFYLLNDSRSGPWAKLYCS